MRSLVALGLMCAAATACGDNTLPDGPPLARSRAVTLLAHQDDDLIFMQPDLLEALQRADGVTNVYVTAGNGTAGIAKAEVRDEGLRTAYAVATGHAPSDWDCGWITIAGHAAEHCRLPAAALSLVFLNYPDGGKVGEQPESLLHLWDGTVATATTVARRPATYDQAGLVATVAELLGDTQPAVIRTLEVAATHGTDHSDHMVVGALALLGAAQAGSTAELTSFRGYDVEDEPANTAATLVARSTTVLEHYDACATDCGVACGAPCPTNPAQHATWLGRRYAVGFRRPLALVKLVDSDLGQCLTLTAGGDIRVDDCAAAPRWSLTAGGALQSDDRCVQRLPTGELVAAHCDAAAVAPVVERWFMDDEGHLWSGAAPIPVDGMDYKHLDCLAAAAAGARAHADLCGQDHAPVWQALRDGVAPAYPVLGAATHVAIGDVDGDGMGDVAWIEAAHLHTMAGTGDGRFSGARVDAGPFDVTPASLVLGDLDGDGHADACGRDATGLVCLVGGVAMRMGPAAAGDGAPDASLTIVAGQLCGDRAGELVCRTAAGVETAVTAGAAGASALWAADLDGDGRPDGCAIAGGGSGGVLCTLAAEHGLAPAPAPWSFAQAGVVDSAATSVATTAFADLDGDGRDDTCDLDATRVACARGQAHGFGPRFTALPGPPAGATQLAAGDLNGDHHADLCVLAGATLACTLSP